MLDQEVTLDEKNVIMYACGYVPVALINSYEKRKDPKYGSFVQCLLHMSIGEYEDTFCGYARKWLESVNHGGAFEGTFNFFLALEISVRHSLSVHLDLSVSGHNEETVTPEIEAESGQPARTRHQGRLRKTIRPPERLTRSYQPGGLGGGDVTK